MSPAGYRAVRILRGMAVVAVVLEVVAATGICAAPHDVLGALVLRGQTVLALGIAGAFVLYVLGRRPRRELLLTAGVGLLGEGVFVAARLLADQPPGAVTAGLGCGLGLSALVTLGRAARRGDGEARERLAAAAILPAFALLAPPCLALTTALHPRVRDAWPYLADAALGFQPSFLAGRLFEALPPLAPLCLAVYASLPLALAGLYGLQRRREQPAAVDPLTAFVAVAVAGFVLYQVFPVVGPVYLFGDAFPYAPPEAGALPPAPLRAPLVPRNCMPSLHTAWALVVYWLARPLGRPVRVAAAAFLGLTLLATLGLGYHYAVDLVAAAPFTLAVLAAVTTQRPATATARSRALHAGAALTLLWLGLAGPGVGVLLLSPVLAWVLVAATLAAVVVLQRGLHAASEGLPPRARPAAPPLARWARPVAAVFVLSGFAGLVYEVVFARALAATFGSTATASTAVLATYMGGLALGTWLGGRLGARTGRPLRLYALCEGGVALWCALSPLLLDGLSALYVAVAGGTDPSHPVLPALQVLLGAGLLLPPTVLMGITLPVLVRQLAPAGRAVGREVGLLYGANTLGAAAGALVAGYVLLPTVGILTTTWLAVAANLAAALVGLRLAGRLRLPGAGEEAAPETSVAVVRPLVRVAGRTALVVLVVGGVSTLVLEIVCFHLLAIVVGNSTYAFSLMLFCFLLGLSGGSAAARRALARRVPPALGLAACQILLAGAVAGGVHLWQAIPDWFLGFGDHAPAAGFGAREMIRFLACCAALLPPALCIGAGYPFAMECVTAAAPGREVRATGRAGALNTAGNIAGAVAGGFLLLPLLGSLWSLYVLAAVALMLGGMMLPHVTRRARTGLVALKVLPVVLLVAGPWEFDWSRLASGANVYFSTETDYGEVVDRAESLDGGLTAVSRRPAGPDDVVHTLTTNGKFQGNDSLRGEMPAQYAIGLLPLLHTRERGRALAIGLGTGNTARAIHEAGFVRTDVVELSGDVVRLARRWFTRVHDGVLDRPGVQTYVTDGRNFLLLQPARYDVISLEVSSIWFAGAASLYNREFYGLVRSRLAEGGVLQQWLQVHHLPPESLVSIVATLRSEFSHVWVYFVRTQGVLVACNHACRPTEETLAALDGAPALAQARALFGGSVRGLLGTRLLGPEGVDRFLQAALERGFPVEDLISTDDNLFLEYDSPRGNVRPSVPSMNANLALLLAGAGGER